MCEKIKSGRSIYFALIFAMLLFGCLETKKEERTNRFKEARQVVLEEIQEIIDSSFVKGSILVFDPQRNIYYSNDFKWANQGKLPASTFKIPNSIIALETGIIYSDSSIIKWDGEKRNLVIWEQDLSFHDAFQFSCVPCYQEIAREIGENRMRKYLAKLEYGEMVFDSNSIDWFWLVGESAISQFQQIDFLERFYNGELPIYDRTEIIMKRMMLIEKTDDYALSGKTGWSYYKNIDNGWFVGYVTKNKGIYYFATNIEPLESLNMDLFPDLRKEITMEALRRLEIIEY